MIRPDRMWRYITQQLMGRGLYCKHDSDHKWGEPQELFDYQAGKSEGRFRFCVICHVKEWI